MAVLIIKYSNNNKFIYLKCLYEILQFVEDETKLSLSILFLAANKDLMLSASFIQ